MSFQSIFLLKLMLDYWSNFKSINMTLKCNQVITYNFQPTFYGLWHWSAIYFKGWSDESLWILGVFNNNNNNNSNGNSNYYTCMYVCMHAYMCVFPYIPCQICFIVYLEIIGFYKSVNTQWYNGSKWLKLTIMKRH